jgi:outer membrane biosynthesis protein TonB
MDRKKTFVLALVYLGIILAIGLVFFVKRDLLFFVPDAFGPVPVGVPWFGALGAVLISLTGVFEHEHDWDDSYWPWHVARPLVGIAVAVVSVLILQAGVLAVGSTPIQPSPTPSPTPAVTQPVSMPTPTPAPTATPTPTATASATPTPRAASTPTTTPTSTPSGSTPQNQPTGPKVVPTNLLYYLVAFLVGYREETFRELIKRLVDVILSPGNGSAPAPTIHDANPPQAPHGTATQVTITGSGFTGTQSVRFGASAAQFTVNGDGKLTVTTPVVPAAGAVILTVTTKGGSASIDFTFN